MDIDFTEMGLGLDLYFRAPENYIFWSEFFFFFLEILTVIGTMLCFLFINICVFITLLYREPA